MTARLWGLLLAACALSAGLFYVTHLQKRANERDAAVAARDQLAAEYATRVKTLERELTEAHAASEVFQDELVEIRNRPVNRTPVRLCKSVELVRADADDPAAGRPDAAAAAAGLVGSGDGADHREGAGPDIGPDLRAYGKGCERLSAQLRGCIRYVERVCPSGTVPDLQAEPD